MAMLPMERYLENVSGGHYKFWRCRLLGRDPSTGRWLTERRWGKIGTVGQNKVEEHWTERAALDHLATLVDDKLGGGYVVVPGNGIPAWPAGNPAMTAPVEAPRAEKPRRVVKTYVTQDADAPATDPAPVRRFIIRGR